MLKNKRVFTDEEKTELWERYNAGDRSVVSELCEAYLPLVETIAYRNKSRLPDCVEVDDLISDGFFGLMDAIEKFDDSAGAKFETYAASRIRGRIYDSLREYDPISRHFRGKFKDVMTITDALAEAQQRQPTDAEIASELKWEIDEVRRIKNFYLSSFTVNIDEYMADSTHESFSLADLIEDYAASNPEYLLAEEDVISILISGLETLTEQESLVLFWKQQEGLTHKEIGERLGIKVPRVSRVYSSAINKLRAGFDNQ